MHRLDKPGYPCLIAQHPAELPHGHREHVLTHHGVGPDRCQQRVFGHEPARLGHQVGKDGKGFRGQTDHRGTAPQAFIPEVELKRSKHEALWRWHPSPFPAAAEPSLLGWHRAIFTIFQEFFTIFQDCGPSLTLCFRHRVRCVHVDAPATTGYTMAPPAHHPAHFSVRWACVMQ